MAAKEIKYDVVSIECSCGNKFSTRSTLSSEKKVVKIEVCSNCHPFYTGKSKIMDTGGRVKQFMLRNKGYAASNKATKEDES